ncbi:cupin domain-containing protein [Carboxylicivirga caseinilyticus]|uniref:cupin domain-containing protein n=1 Tax=Carboxylicivirga caseinilyticus TaxID=3417572 RepID=UPI003D343313|nr:cupin domain-containing protein [Marinilabiliaceae bacterium A049]
MIYPYYEKSAVLKTEQAYGYLLAETDNNDIVELHILKNGLVPAHALPVDVVFYVISGRGKITIANEITNALKGDVITVKKNLDRTWQNPFDEPLKLLVIKQKP